MVSLKIRTIKYNYFMNLLLTGSSIFFPLITFPLVSRALHSDMYGLCNWSFSIASWLSLIAMLGVNKYGIREVARNRDDIEALVRITAEITTFTLISTFVVLFCFVISIFIVPSLAEYRDLFLVNSLTVLCNTLGVNWFFQGVEQYKYITIRGVVIKAAGLVGVIAFVHTPDDYLIYALLVILSAAVANVVNFIYMIHLLTSDLRASNKVISLLSLGSNNFLPLRHFKPMMIFFVIAAAISVYTVLDTVMLGFLSSNQEVGFYSAAANVKSALVGVVSALSGVLLPRVSNMLRNGKAEEYRALIRKCIKIVLFVSVPSSILLAMIATPLISWYAGTDFVGAGTPLSILAISVIPISLSMIFCDVVLVPHGLEKYCSRIYIIAAIVNFISNIALIPVSGAIGAAISTLLVELLITFVEFAFARKIIWA